MIQSRFLACSLVAMLFAAPARGQGSDSCATPQVIVGFASWSVDNTAATTGTQGQDNELCRQFNVPGIARDVWFVWNAPFTGTARFDMCGFASWDTKLAVYEGSGCPSCAPLACNDDTCGLQSRVDFPVTSGMPYTIQVGSYPLGGTGTGFVTSFNLGPAHAPILHYKFDSTVNPGFDSSGHGHQGIVGAGGSQVVGQCGRAFRFGPNNDTSELEAADSPELNMLGAASGSAWFRPRGPHDGQVGCPQGTILSKAGNYWFQIEEGNDGLTFQNEGSGNDVLTVPIPPLPVDEWSHIAFVRSANALTISFFVNGNFVGQGALSTAPSTNNWPLEFGNGQYFQACELNGELDEIKLWNVALNSAEVYAEYAGTPHPNPVTSISGPSSVCQGASGILAASGGCGDVIEWFANSCGGVPIASGSSTISFVGITATTTYYARWRSSDCGVSTCASFTVVVHAPSTPPSSVNALPSTICLGSSTTLVASGGSGDQFIWTDTTNGATYSGTSVNVSPTSTRTYTGRWTSSPCPDSASLSVTVTVAAPNLAPSSVSANVNPSCAGSPVVLTATGGSGQFLRWYLGGCGGSPFAVGNGITVTPGSTTMYYARWESAACPPSPCVPVTVVVVPPPVAPTGIVPDHNPTCAGTPVTLTAVGGSGTTVRWLLNGCNGTSLGTGPAISVSPTQSTTYSARWESPVCGASACASFTVDVIPQPVPPIAAVASSTNICLGESTLLNVIGGSGQELRWHLASCDGPLVYSGPAVDLLQYPTATTTYLASWSTNGCAESTCAAVTVTVTDHPQNDDCPNALDLPVGISPIYALTNFDTRCATTDGPTHAGCAYYGDPQIGKDVWYRYHATVEGSLRLSTCYPAVTGFDTRIAVYRGLACPVDDSRLMTCGDDSGPGCSPGTTLNVRVDDGQDYLIRVGGRGLAAGVGQLLAQLTVPSPCPPPGPSIATTYSLCGTPSNVTWQWRIRATSGGFATLQGVAGPVPTTGNAFALANAFKSSIDGVVAQLPGGCAGALTTSTLLLGLTDCQGTAGGGTTASLTVACTVPFDLSVWDTTSSPADWCTLDTNSVTPICHFNPTGEQVPLPGADCNYNTLDDLLDIYLGTSLDADGNLIPDECPVPAGNAFCFGDGSGLGCPCGNNAPVGVAAGCRNSLGLYGRLVGSGSASLSGDTFRLSAEGMPNSSALYFQGTTQVGAPFGDGLRCAGGSTVRLGTVVNSGFASTYPPAGAPAISVRGLVTVPGSFRSYQVWYRNAAAYCTGSTFNLTNGVSLTWAP